MTDVKHVLILIFSGGYVGFFFAAIVMVALELLDQSYPLDLTKEQKRRLSFRTFICVWAIIFILYVWLTHTWKD